MCLTCTEGHNLNKKMHREKAWKTFARKMSRGCLWEHVEAHFFANLWRLFGKPWDPAERHKLLNECEQHVRLCVMMYNHQMQHGRYSAHDFELGDARDLEVHVRSRCVLCGDLPSRDRSSAIVTRS